MDVLKGLFNGFRYIFGTYTLDGWDNYCELKMPMIV